MMRIHHQKGVGLIEILVTLVILAIGILGLAGLQTQSLKNNEIAMQRSQAVVLTYAAFDMLRVNRTAAIAGAYNMGMTCTAPTNPSTLVANDQAYWINTLQTALGSTACGSINCQTTGDCIVQVRWTDQRASGGGNLDLDNDGINETTELATRSRL